MEIVHVTPAAGTSLGGAGLGGGAKAKNSSRWAMAANNLAPREAAEPNYVYELNPKFSLLLGGSKSIAEMDEMDDDTGLTADEVVSKLRFARYGVHGEGSCAFHSLCVVLNHMDYVHLPDAKQKEVAYAFRCSFGKKLTAEKLRQIGKKVKGGKSPQNLAEMQENLCNPKIWADETIIRWVAESLDMNLIFLDLDKKVMYCGVHHDDAVNNVEKMPPTAIILWVNHSHFEPLCVLHQVDKHTSKLQAMFDPSTNERDAKIVRCLMKKYKMQCKIH